MDIGGIWRSTFFIGEVFLLAMVMYNRIPRIVFALWFYSIVQALYILEFPALPFGDYNTAYQATAGQVVTELLIIPLSFFLLKPKVYKWIWRAIPLVVLYEIYAIWVHSEARPMGLMISPSFDSAFISLALPFMPLWIALPVIITVVTHHGSTALLILLAEAFAWGIVSLTKKPRKKQIAIFLGLSVLAGAILGVAYVHSHSQLFDGMERIAAYKRYMKFWAQDWHFITFGVGPGSFMWTSMMIDKWTPPLFLQMHSDWLQILFELGTVGFLLVCGVFFTALKNVWGKLKLMAALFGVAAFALTYHPLRFFPPALLVGLIFYEALFNYKKR